MFISAITANHFGSRDLDSIKLKRYRLVKRGSTSLEAKSLRAEAERMLEKKRAREGMRQRKRKGRFLSGRR